MKLFVFLLSLCFALPMSAETPATKVTHVDAEAAAKFVQEKKVDVLDVRTADEFKEGHIAGAKNIDFTENTFAALVKELDKTKPLLVHCAAGGRSTKSLEVLKKEGFTNVYHLDGGFKNWEKAGKPVTK
jgi:rhodanese-related sulfurtransferase